MKGKKKYLSRKVLIAALSLICLVGLSAIDTRANAYTNFDLLAGYNWSSKSSADVKEDDHLQAHIQWTYSSASSHKEWFRMVNSDGYVRGIDLLLNYKTSGFLTELSSATKGYYYYLQAKREHIIDPTTNVRGTWDS